MALAAIVNIMQINLQLLFSSDFVFCWIDPSADTTTEAEVLKVYCEASYYIGTT